MMQGEYEAGKRRREGARMRESAPAKTIGWIHSPPLFERSRPAIGLQPTLEPATMRKAMPWRSLWVETPSQLVLARSSREEGREEEREADAPDLAQVPRHGHREGAHERDERAAEEAVEDGVRDEERLGRHDAHEEGHRGGAEAAHGLDVEGPTAGREYRASVLALREAPKGGEGRKDEGKRRLEKVARDSHKVGKQVGDDATEGRSRVK